MEDGNLTIEIWAARRHRGRKASRVLGKRALSAHDGAVKYLHEGLTEEFHMHKHRVKEVASLRLLSLCFDRLLGMR